jgi:2-polyprenyl-6-methoxyphenol hydroxylase-like FAD-dependent oxidoreductase
MAAIVVLGGGVCGLTTALLLNRDGHDVLVLERDAAPVPDSPDQAWDDWSRPGVSQFRLPHYLHARTAGILGTELPDVRAGLLAAGALRYDPLDNPPPALGVLARRADDDRFATVTARRSTLEQVLARAAADEPGLRVDRGVHVQELITRMSDGVGRVTAVRTSTGRRVVADLVVDATGRRSPLPDWLRAAGHRPLQEEAEDSGFTYYSRFFRSRDGRLPAVRANLLSPMGSFSVLTLPADRQTWSVTLVTDSHDRPLKELRHEEIWTSVVAACPAQAHWLDGEPFTGVLAMSGVLDRYRRLTVGGTPVVTGVVAVGDSSACTNPSLGRGISLGWIQAVCLRDALRVGAEDDPRAFAARWDDDVEATVTPWYRATVSVDRDRLGEMRGFRDGRPPAPPQGPAALGPALFGAAAHDPELFRAALEVVGCLTLPQDVFSRPGLVEQVLRVSGEHPPPQSRGPDREQLLQLVAGVPAR